MAIRMRAALAAREGALEIEKPRSENIFLRNSESQDGPPRGYIPEEGYVLVFLCFGHVTKLTGSRYYRG